MSTIHTNLAKWQERAAWFHAWPAVTSRPFSSVSRARAAWASPFATQAGSHSAHVSTREVTRWKSLKSTPLATKRGAQFAIAASTRSSGMSHLPPDRLLDARAEVAQHDGGRVPAGPGRHRRARMGGRAGLVQTRDGEPVLGPAGHRPQRARLGDAHLAPVAGAVPIVGVQPLQVHRALHQGGENRVVGQVRGIPAHVLEAGARHLVGHLVPALPAAVGKAPGMEADDLERVLALRRASGVGNRWA